MMRRYLFVVIACLIGIEVICRVLFFGPRLVVLPDTDEPWKVQVPNDLISQEELRPRLTKTELERLSTAHRLSKSYAKSNDNLFGDLEPHRDYLNLIDPDHPFRVVTDAKGLRRVEPTKDRDAVELRVLCLGDSFTFGPYVANHETYPAVAEAILRKTLNKEIEVLNAGQSGYSMSQELELYKERAQNANADIIVLQVLDNDLQGYISSQFHRPDSPKYIRLLSQRASFRINAFIKAHSDHVGMFYLLVKLSGSPVIRSMSSRIRSLLLRSANASLTEGNRLEDVDVTEARDPSVKALWLNPDRSGELERAKRLNEKDFAELVEVVQSRSAELILMYLPTQESVRAARSGGDAPDRYYKQLAGKYDVRYLSLLDEFVAKSESRYWYLWPWNGHLSSFGYHTVGRALSQQVIEIIGRN